jgi:hypothetical protein
MSMNRLTLAEDAAESHGRRGEGHDILQDIHPGIVVAGRLDAEPDDPTRLRPRR